MSSSSEKDVDVQNFASYPLIPRPDIDIGKQLGRGAYGSVYKGTWKNGDHELVVALKKVFMLEKEADILSKVRHRNIIQFFGVCHTNPDFFIVTEFAENGCLFEYLHEHDFQLEFDLILTWAIQIANGVQYLHCEAPVTIIHRDLKSKNIVLGKNLVCKLCDFGTSKDLTHSYTQPTWGGTAAWMSPEIINQNDKITTASDVWSYAVVLWELTSREIPYKGLSEFKIYTIISTLSQRLVIPETCPKQLANLLRSCWKGEPDERPNMREVMVELENISQNTELNEEVATFVKDKNQWKEDIGKQLKELDELKLDLMRKSEELDRRERALRKRENSQRNLLLSTAYNSHAASWSVDSVCEWVRNISFVLETPVDPHVVEKICDIVRKHEICGYRLLEITPHDLDALGIENLEVRAELSKQIMDLKVTGLDPYPSLQLVKEIEERKKKEKSLNPFDVPIVVHLGLYQRRVHDRPGVPYRTKKYFWIPFVACVLRSDTWSGCVHELDEEVTVVCVVTYTDQVLQPRNTCIRSKIHDFSKATTIEDRSVTLKLRPIATGTTITRRNSSFLVPPATPASPVSPLSPLSLVNGLNVLSKTPSQNLLAMAWRNRRSSSRMSTSPDLFGDFLKPKFKSQPLLGKSPIWAEIAATLRQPLPPATHVQSSPAVTNAATKEIPLSKQLPSRSISDYPGKNRKPAKKSSIQKQSRVRGNTAKHSVSFGNAPTFRRHSLATPMTFKKTSPLKEMTNEEATEARPSFYLDNGRSDEDLTTTGDSSESQPTQRNNVTPPESPTTSPIKRCCERNDCRRNMKQKPCHPKEENDEENEKTILGEDGRLLRPKKNKNKTGRKSKEPSPTDGTEPVVEGLNKLNLRSKGSRDVYGGKYKWSWKPTL
ncbi:hypothetical protein L596_018964 [Steinernema carpocapsae]|uniref:Protein kinase domain-containing protein n=1 Tax=Steinernema carpocapsae TaxID=34508 RepID=A0A4U5N733_STECR|nr:hypothetical protein L596_018964 [Steinernema carpocapsae]